MINSIASKSQKSIQSVRFANSPDDLIKRFNSNSFYHIYNDEGTMIFATTTNNIPILVKASVSGSNINTETYSPVGLLYPLVEESLAEILTN